MPVLDHVRRLMPQCCALDETASRLARECDLLIAVSGGLYLDDRVLDFVSRVLISIVDFARSVSDHGRPATTSRRGLR